jgi:hypothetical protein
MNNKGGKFNQSTLYVYIKLPQWNSFIQLIYVNEIRIRKEMWSVRPGS